MFLLNSRLGLFAAATSLWHPFSLSYGAFLPSSLTTLLPPACGFSPHLPVSVCGTGRNKTIAAFLDSLARMLPYFSFSPRHSSVQYLTAWTGLSIPGSSFASCVPTVLFVTGTGISTCFPSTTSFDLALGPDLPRADQLDSGSLRFSA